MIDTFPISIVGNRVIVELEAPTQDGLILLPENRTEPPCLGRVVAIGSGKCCKCHKYVPIEVKIGDKIVYQRYGNTKEEIRVGGKPYFILPIPEIIAVYTEPKPEEKPELDVYGKDAE